MERVVGVVLAAGMGTRMRSKLIKVLHPLGGQPMLAYTLRALEEIGVSRIVVIVGNQSEEVRSRMGERYQYALQAEQLGTGHAVFQAEELLRGFQGTVLVTCGDTPLYRPETFADMIRAHQQSGAAATLLATHLDRPHGYGRVVRDSDGRFVEIVEQRDIADPRIEAICEVNAGTYCFDAQQLFDALRRVGNDNEQGEYYLPDALKILRADGATVHIHTLSDWVESLGINDRRQLAEAEAVLRRRILEAHMERGVTIVDPATTYIHQGVQIGRDSVIYPFTSLEGTTSIGEDCHIGPHARIVDSRLGDRVVFEQSVAKGCTLESGAQIGPFQHIS